MKKILFGLMTLSLLTACAKNPGAGDPQQNDDTTATQSPNIDATDAEAGQNIGGDADSTSVDGPPGNRSNN